MRVDEVAVWKGRPGLGQLGGAASFDASGSGAQFMWLLLAPAGQ